MFIPLQIRLNCTETCMYCVSVLTLFPGNFIEQVKTCTYTVPVHVHVQEHACTVCLSVLTLFPGNFIEQVKTCTYTVPVHVHVQEHACTCTCMWTYT